MIPVMLTGMVTGMVVAMRAAMAPLPIGEAMQWGAALGIATYSPSPILANSQCFRGEVSRWTA